MRALVVEDQIDMMRYIDMTLRSEMFHVDRAETVEEGRFKAGINQYSIILLDWNLPDGDGLTLCHDLRQENIKTPIMMLSIRNSVIDKVMGLETGADDYLTKPFAGKELVARVSALIRRGTRQTTCLYKCPGELELETRARRVTLKGRPVSLTRREFDLLQFFMEHECETIPRESLWEQVWGWDDYPLHNTVEVHITRLRRKVGDRWGKLIQTVRGVGYRFEPPVLK